MPSLLLLAAAVLAVLNWITVGLNFKPGDYASKPAVILSLIAGIGLACPTDGTGTWVLVALTFSLVGDIFLLLPTRYFLAGLISFLVAHLSYILAINQTTPYFSPLHVPIFLGTVSLSCLLFRHLSRALDAKGQRTLLVPLALYTLFITGTLFSSLSTLAHPGWNRTSSLLVSAGGSLFYLSDTLLAWHRYITPIPRRDLIVRVTYHTAQMGLVSGALLQIPG